MLWTTCIFVPCLQPSEEIRREPEQAKRAATPQRKTTSSSNAADAAARKTAKGSRVLRSRGSSSVTSYARANPPPKRTYAKEFRKAVMEYHRLQTFCLIRKQIDSSPILKHFDSVF